MKTAIPASIRKNVPVSLLTVEEQLELIQAACNVREAQRKYFNARRKSSTAAPALLKESRAYEATLDDILSEVIAKCQPDSVKQQSLF